MGPSDIRRFEGTCDASAAIMLGSDRLVVANDEDDRLRVYAPGGGPPLQTIDLAAAFDVPDPGRESDLEAAATLDGITWWIGSHARNARAKKRANRRVLIATRVTLDGETPIVELLGAHHSRRSRGLLGALLRLPEIGPRLAKAERRAPKAKRGFNIEGLAAIDGTLAIGFRNPLIKGRALVVYLHDPPALLRNETPTLSWTTIDLGGRGIRSLVERSDGSLLIAAGCATRGPDDFALFRWSGHPDDEAEPFPMPSSLRGTSLRPEALVPIGPDRLLVISDDGAVKNDGQRCKDLPASQRQFRATVVSLSPEP